MTEAGSGSVQDKEKALLSQILQKLNDLFTGDLSDNDQLSYAMTVKGKLLDNQVLVQQAANNLKEQFSTSPALSKAVLAAIMDAFETHAAMSKQALDSQAVQEGLKDALLGPGQLYEALRERAA
jgi:type I restriction enzyme R subunit